MDVLNSNLSAQKYGYDLVASTSQESISGIMMQSITQAAVEGTWYFFRSSNPGSTYDICGKEEALKKTNGIDPFDTKRFPDIMSTNDANYTALYDAGLSFACDFVLGLPLDMTGDQLPQPCVVLGEEQDKVLLNVYFQTITFVQTRTESGSRVWRRTCQQRGAPWYATIKLNIVQEDMPSIENDSYFSRNKEAASEIKTKVQGGGGSEPSFRQVVLGWNNYDVINVESQGTPADTTGNLMSALHHSVAKLQGVGLAPLCVLAKSGASEAASLVSACDWQVTRYAGHANVSTLDVLCMIDGHQLPARPHPDFDWHWMEPGEDEGQVHGFMSVNAQVIAALMKAQCWDKIANTFCVTFQCLANDAGLLMITSGHADLPKAYVQLCPSPGVLLQVDYVTLHDATNKDTKLWIDYSYKLEIKSAEKSFTASQDVTAHITITYESSPSTCTITAHNEDTYDISVNSEGDLATKWRDGSVVSPKNSFVSNSAWPSYFKYSAEACVTVFYRDEFTPKIGTKVLDTMPLSNLGSFVFPGGQVYSYNDPKVSKFNDLLCGITYRPPRAINYVGGDKLDIPEAPEAGRRPPASPSSGMTLTYSSDLIQNYIPGKAVDIVGSSSKFLALQAKNGNSMILTVNSSGALTIIREQSSLFSSYNNPDESSKLGWIASPLTEQGKSVINFDASQHAVTGAINVAVVMETSNREVLFTSIGNSHEDFSWTSKPNWKPIEYDAKPTAPPKLHIAGLLFAEASHDYLIADINRPDNDSAYIERYHIKSSPKPGEKHWNIHDVPGDFLRDSFRSCVGRSKGERVDGVYTSGREGGRATAGTQLCYQAIENIYQPTIPAPPCWLFLPKGHEAPLAGMPIATIHVASSSSSSSRNTPTDLYAVANSSLYRWGADNQKDRARGQLIISKSPLLSETHTLHAMAQDGIATIWGLNKSKQLFTVSCEAKLVSDPTKWSAPIPAALEIERLSAYVNAVDGGNTIFALSHHQKILKEGDARLSQFTKQTKGSKLWKAQNIMLPVLPHEKSKPIMSYTTSIAVKDEHGHGVSGAKLSITTASRTSVYINGHYHILSREPTTVTVDTVGTVTVVEATETLSAAALTVKLQGTGMDGVEGNDAASVEIKPHDNAYTKIRKLETKEAIQGATIPNNIVGGGYWETSTHRSLVSTGMKDGVVDSAAEIIGKLNKLHTELEDSPQRGAGSEEEYRVLPAAHSSEAMSLMSGSRGFLTEVGDFLHVLWESVKNGVKVAIDWVWDKVNKTYRVVMKFLNQVYEAIVRTVDDIVAGIVWVFNKIVHSIQDVIEYVKVLFEWSDIRRTKDVFHKVVTLWLDHEVGQIDEGKALFDKAMDGAIKAVDKWAGFNHDWKRLDGAEKNTSKQNSKDPGSGQTAASSLFLNHMKNNIGGMALTQSVDALPEITASMMRDVTSDLPAPTADNGLQSLYDKLCALAHEFQHLSVEEVLKKLFAILAEGALVAVKAVADAVLTALSKLAKTALKILDMKIHIPIISDILNAIGIPDISFIDLFMWIGAVAYTVVYKLANHNKPPFSEAVADSITSVSTWDALVKLFHPAVAQDRASIATTLPIDRSAMFHGGHGAAGITGISRAILHTLEIAQPSNSSSLISWSSVAATVISAVLAGAAESLAPRCTIENKDFVTLNRLVIAHTILWSVTCAVAGDDMLKPIAKRTGLKFIDGRGAGAVVAAIIRIPALVVSAHHFSELAQKPASAEKTASILGEVSAVTSSISTLAYAVAANTSGQVKAVAVVVVGVSDVATAGLQIAEAAIPY
ncbi:gamma-glutamyltranspeptidase periplasmic precursor [Cordyceps militaris CM01]|uniref:Gamma-glutamyltranspeptidase periplasmic n=1 Tax=Cordyceps militaris (strain CM01) TaxID=983644 RepID=G3JFR9_CORMM|nr:gamma-glutamyltranspeptidase periplasmic precursor [Cordyceps militaris CM01]EGX92302.1 gamma-glutamyltranspeptidase periplasmic precursor [Cordyceps militaris CM01]